MRSVDIQKVPILDEDYDSKTQFLHPGFYSKKFSDVDQICHFDTQFFCHIFLFNDG